MVNFFIDQNPQDISFSPFSRNVNNLGYLKVTDSTEFFSLKNYYQVETDFWLQKNIVNGSVTHLPNTCQARLSIGSGATDRFTFQTKQCFVYVPGGVQRLVSAIVASNLQTGTVLDYGLFDDNNGSFFRIKKTVSGFDFQVVRRNQGVDEVVDQVIDGFNVDPLDGTGDSEITLDCTKIQMLHLEVSWYGAGGITYGVEVDRRITWFHNISAGNNLSNVIFGDPDLPIRYDLYNTQATAGTSTVDIGGIRFSSDGVDIESRRGYTRAYAREPVNVSTGQTRNIVTLRPKTTFRGRDNHASTDINSVVVYGSADGIFEVRTGVVLSTPVWNDVDTANSYMEGAINPVISTDGITRRVGGITSNRGADKIQELTFKEPLVSFSDGSGANTISLVFRALSNGNIGGGFNWTEVY